MEAEIRKADSPLIGSVAYFPEEYGSKILPLVLKFLYRQPVPPATHTAHQLVAKENINYHCRASGILTEGLNSAALTWSYTMTSDGSSPDKAAKESESPDHYEVLQLSRNAHPETIRRVFRILAKRYHPDNPETGNQQLFREIVEAARVLTDPQLRAAHDARLTVQSQNRFKIFETWQTSRGVEAEKRKRKGILALLYGRRLTDPREPSLGLRELEEMLGCPREHLQFALWFLKESKCIKAAENAQYEITCQGVLVAEEETNPLQPPVPQLSAPKL